MPHISKDTGKESGVEQTVKYDTGIFERSESIETAFVTLLFSMEWNLHEATFKPNVTEVQLPPHYSRNEYFSD